MNLDKSKVLKTLNPNKIWVPAVISVGFVIFMIWNDDDFTPQKLKLIFQARYIPLILACLMLVVKDLAYIWRIRVLTNKDLTWKNSFFVIVLWEFASAVTPSVVGGSAVAVFILLKEKINLGKSLAYVTLTAILDNLFFVIAAPLALLFLGKAIFPESIESVTGIFITSYTLIAVYTLGMCFALFINPRLFKWFLIRVTSIKVFRKWRYAAYQHGNELMWASSLIKGKRKRYWTQIIGATIIAWTARYVILNFVIMAYSGNLSFTDNILILGKHLFLWIVMLLSPTPGSTGTAEHFFMQFFDGYLLEYTLGATLLWRVISYYPYLLAGAIVLPAWLRRVFSK